MFTVAQSLVEKTKGDAAGDEDQDRQRAAGLGKLPGKLRREKEIPGQERGNQCGADTAGQATDQRGKEGDRVEENPAGKAHLRPEEPLQQASGERQQPGKGEADIGVAEKGCRFH